MAKYIQVKGHPNLGRDSRTGAIININESEMTQARLRKKKWREQQQKMMNLEDDVREIKMLLKTLIEDKHADNSITN